MRAQRVRQRGQALAEFALVVPLLLLLLMGTVDGGRTLFAYVALQEAAQEGALFASHAPGSLTAIANRVRTSSNVTEVIGSTVTRACSTATTPGHISITVSYNLPVLTPVFRAMFGPTIRVAAVVNGTIIRGACS